MTLIVVDGASCSGLNSLDGELNPGYLRADRADRPIRLHIVSIDCVHPQLLTIFLCLVILGNQSVIMVVRLSTGSPSIVKTRSMCGTKSVCGRHHALSGRTSGHAGGIILTYLSQGLGNSPGIRVASMARDSGLGFSVGLRAIHQYGQGRFRQHDDPQELEEQPVGFCTSKQVLDNTAWFDAKEPPQTLSSVVW